MGVFESLGITQSKSRTGRGPIGLNIGIIIVAIGAVSLISRAWIFSSALIALGVVVIAISAVNSASKRRQHPGSDPR